MKIGIEAQRIFREHKHGMDFVVLEMIRQLQQIDTQNEYFIYVNEGPDTTCLTETDNFKIRVFGGAYPIWEQFKLPKAAKKDGVELLHCTSNTAPINCPMPLLTTIHDIIYFETHPLKAKGYSNYQKFGNLYRRFVVSRIIHTSKKIITVSEFEKQRFKSFLGLQPDHVQVIYNGVGAHFKRINDEAYLDSIIKKYKLPERYFLFLGNTDPKKNTRNAVLAFARYCQSFGRDYYLVIGDLDPEVIKGYLAAEKLEAYFTNIHFTGYINNQELPAIINRAEVFLYPSKRESFGIPILEGMACGTPVITGNTSSMPEVAGDAAILVNPDDVNQIADALSQLVDEKGLRKELIEKGIKRAAEFSWKKTAEQALELYKNVLNK